MPTTNDLVAKWLIRREALEATIRPAALRHGILHHEIPAVMAKVLPVFAAQFIKDHEAGKFDDAADDGDQTGGQRSS